MAVVIDPSSSGMKKLFSFRIEGQVCGRESHYKGDAIRACGAGDDLRTFARRQAPGQAFAFEEVGRALVRILEGKGPTHDRSPCREVWARGLRAAVGAQRRGRGAEDGGARGENDGLGSALFGKDHKPADPGAAAVGVNLGFASGIGDRDAARFVEERAPVIVAKVHAINSVGAGGDRLVEKRAEARNVADNCVVRDGIASDRRRSRRCGRWLRERGAKSISSTSGDRPVRPPPT